MGVKIDFSKLTGFDWDESNITKNWDKHKVDYREAEEIFFNHPLKVFPDEGHSETEARYLAIGKTLRDRLLTIIFTLRGRKIRIISARPQSKKERKIYES